MSNKGTFRLGGDYMTFDIKYNVNKTYPIVIYSVPYINPLENIDDISSALSKCNVKPCNVLFDLLLSNGDEFNRFASGYFDGTKINYNSLEIINLNNCDIIKSINSYYKDNISCLNNGVLTSSQKLKFAKL